MRVTAVFGISGVGKSWLVGRFVESHDVCHAQASALMREAKAAILDRPVASEELRTGKVVDNQTLLVDAFAALRRRETRDIVFDGHNLIDTEQGFVEIPFDVIAALMPSAIVVIIDDPAAIAARRQADAGRARPSRTVEDLDAYQKQVVTIAHRHAEALSIPFLQVQSGALAEFETAMAI